MTHPANGLKQVSRTPRSVRGDAALLTDDELARIVRKGEDAEANSPGDDAELGA